MPARGVVASLLVRVHEAAPFATHQNDAPLPHKYCHLAGHGARVQNAVATEALHVIDGHETGTVGVEHTCLASCVLRRRFR